MYGEDTEGGYGPDMIDVSVRAQETGRATGPVVSPLHSSDGPIPEFRTTPLPAQLEGLGALSLVGSCSVRALAQVAWRFFTEVSSGPSLQYLSTLAVYRSLYNQKRAAIASGLSPAALERLPASIPVSEWSTAVRQSIATIYGLALGDGHPALATLPGIPVAMSGIPAWQISLRNALDAGDLERLRTYLELPTITGTAPEVALARAVAADLRECGTPAQPAPPAPPPPAQPPRVNGTATPATPPPPPPQPPPPRTPGAAPVSTAAAKILGIGLLALVGYGVWKASQDKRGALAGPENLAAGPKLLASGVEALKAKALKVGQKDGAEAAEGGRECIPGRKTRKSFSMDEYGGPGAEKLSMRITRLVDKLPAPQRRAAGHDLEDAYFLAFVEALRASSPNLPECE